MKRRLAAALLIITLPLGMAACHGSKSRKATPSTPAPAATANANPTQAPGQAPAQPQAPMPTQAPLPSNQSVDEACNIVAGTLKTWINSVDDPNNFAKSLAAAENAINGLNSPQITNPDVKQAASALASSMSEMVNYGKKYQSNPNAADQKEGERVVSNMTSAMLTLNNLCPSALGY